MRGWTVGHGVIAFAALVVLAPSVARAAPEPPKREELVYAEARGALDAGDYDKACPLFLEYHRLTGIPAALFTLAECEVRWGKPARALTHYEEFLRRTKDATASPVQEQRARVAKEQVVTLTTQVARVKPVVGSAVKGSVLVKLDGVPIPVPVTDPMVIEPGEHTLELMTDAGAREQRRFVVGAGEVREIELGTTPASNDVSGQRSTQPGSPGAVEPSSARAFSTPVIILGGVGIAGVATSLVLGGLALAKKGDVDENCVGNACTREGKDAADTVQSLGAASTVAFAIGAVSLATAVILYVVQRGAAKPVAQQRPFVLVGGNGIGGSF